MQFAALTQRRLISAITDEVMAEAQEWQSLPLDRMYPVVFFDALRLKPRDDGSFKNKAVYLAVGVDTTGRKDVLGPWQIECRSQP